MKKICLEDKDFINGTGRIVTWDATTKLQMLKLIMKSSAEKRYALMMANRISPEEIDEWANKYAQHGLRGLKATRRNRL